METGVFAGAGEAMDAETVSSALELLSGHSLSPEQTAAVRCSLLLLRRDMRLSRAFFWGKILGVRGDYYIAQGTEGDQQLTGRRSFYSLNCLDWCLLPPATDDVIREAELIKGRFIGDPSHEYQQIIRRKAEEGLAEEEVTNHITEESRLVATIALIDREAAVAPRGALIKNPDGGVNLNRSFGGLTVSEATKLSSFFHFTPTPVPKKKSLLEKADLDPAIDFLNSLEHDVPKGCWSLQLEQGSSVVVLRSLIWLGTTFFHVPLTPQHGYVYIGNGERNTDLPFMI